jgi:hypothetical protein
MPSVGFPVGLCAWFVMLATKAGGRYSGFRLPVIFPRR